MAFTRRSRNGRPTATARTSAPQSHPPALSEGVSKAMVSDLVAKEQRAGAIGMFYTVSGIGQLLGSILAGQIWHVRLANGVVHAPFAAGGLFALMGVIVLTFVPMTRRK